MKVLMIHGYKGTSTNGWFLTVQQMLEMEGISFFSPNLPNPENPIYELWKKEIIKCIEKNGDSPITIVAHSLGCFAILRIIDEMKSENFIQKIRNLVLVAPVVCFHQKFKVFTNYIFNLKDFILSYLKHVYIFYSEDDTYVEKSDIMHFIQMNEKCELISKNGYGHFMQDDLPFITDAISKIVHLNDQ